MENSSCPVCKNASGEVFKEVNQHQYFQCLNCDVLFISPVVLENMDNGKFLINYNSNYWNKELKAAKERSWGTALARTAEVFLYARLPIMKFIDIGSGPGYFLDAINYQLPSSKDVFYAAELFPPAEEFCTNSPNYFKGDILNLDFQFDAGCCIEVIEHLTPKMVESLFLSLAKKSKKNSIYVFNTGLVEYIINEEPAYLDPNVRGHVMGWSIKAIQILAEPAGFNIIPIPGKTWAFIAEYLPEFNSDQPITDRIWSALPENIRVLSDKLTGNVMYVLGLDTARAYS